MSREAMDAALKETFVPALRERGFKGSLPHFRRLLSDRIDLLAVQQGRSSVTSMKLKSGGPLANMVLQRSIIAAEHHDVGRAKKEA
jgi:hypothetical protein